MALDEETPETPAPTPAPKRSRTALAVGTAAGVALATVLALLLGREEPPPPAPVEPQLVLIEDPDGVLPGAMLPLGSFVVNLGAEDEFIKIRITAELYELELPPGIVARLPKLRDTVIGHLGKKTSKELVSSDGRENLRQELLAQLNKDAPENERVVDLYFEEYVVQ